MEEGFRIVYGVEGGSGRICVVQTGRRMPVRTVFSGASSSPEAGELLRTIAEEVEKGNAALAAAAPAAQTVVRSLQAPFASIRKARRVWDSLLDVNLPFPVESAARCFGAPRMADGKTTCVAAAIRKRDLQAADDVFPSEDLVPTHRDAEALALWHQQGLEAPPARADVSRILVWLGDSHVTVVRGIGTNWTAAHVLRASPCSGSPEEQAAFDALWSSRMRQILAAHQAETVATEMDLWWAGPGAADEARVRALRKLLPSDLPLRQEIHRDPSSFLARALARRVLEDSGFNLKQGDAVHPALLRREAAGMKKACFSVVAASLLLLAVDAGVLAVRKHRADALQARLTAAAEAVTGGPVIRGQEQLLVERAIDRLDAETRPFRSAMDPIGLEGRLALLLDEAAALKLQISRLALSPMVLTMEGSGTSIQAVENFSDGLRARWQLQAETPGRTTEGRYRFVLKGTAPQ